MSSFTQDNKIKNHAQDVNGDNFDESDIEALLCELECGTGQQTVTKGTDIGKVDNTGGSKPSCAFSTYGPVAGNTRDISHGSGGGASRHMASGDMRQLYSHPTPRLLAGGQRLAPIRGDNNSKSSKKGDTDTSVPSAAGVQEVLALATRQGERYANEDLPSQQETSDAGYHHFNFLPVMHAEKLERDHHLTGILPKPRWGHTFVAIEDCGSPACNASGTPAGGSVASLVLFGGTVTMGKAGDGEEGETNDLFEFRVGTQSWEPLYTKGSSHLAGDPPVVSRKVGGNRNMLRPSSVRMSHHSNLPVTMVPPARRTMHTAVVHQNRYLLVFGGTADHGTTFYNDVHSFDMVTRQWCHLGAESYSHEPSGRFGHSAVEYSNRMYVFGGKCAKREDAATGGSITSKNTQLTNDVQIFDLSTNSWRKRVGVSNGGSDKKKSKKKALSSPSGENDEGDITSPAEANGPCKRFHHSATVLGGDMYIHGGEASDGTILSDSWAFNFERKEWRLAHCGVGGGNVPRSRHFLYGCGEALLAMGGISNLHHQRSLKDPSISVLPVLQRTTVDDEGDILFPIPADETQWIPVIMSNTLAIPYSKKNFGATAQGGFVYSFGGLDSSTEAANNSLVRCLAMDGVPLAAQIQETNLGVSPSSKTMKGGYYPVRSIRESGLGLLTKRMARMLEDTAFFDVYIALPSSLAAMNGSSSGCCFGAHQLILLIRAPYFYEKVLQCPEWLIDGPSGEGTVANTLATFGAPPGDENLGETGITNTTDNKSTIPCYNIASRNNRAQGLKVGFTPEALRSFLYFIYTGSIVITTDTTTEGENREDGGASEGSTTSTVLSLLDEIAKEYQIPSLSIAIQSMRHNNNNNNINNSPLRRGASPSHEEPLKNNSSLGVGKVRHQSNSQPREYSAARGSAEMPPQSQIIPRFGETCRLSDELAALLASGQHATATVLFIDPHSKIQSTRVIHPLVVMNASNIFRNILKPLLSTAVEGSATSTALTNNTQSTAASVTSNTFAGITAKKKGGITTTATPNTFNKRAIIIGPVPIPTMSIDTVLSYLYTASLNIHPEAALPTLMAAHTLGLPDLQAHCESIVAREEVNYETSLSYLLLAENHGAMLLEELSLLTAALGLDEVIGAEFVNYDRDINVMSSPQQQVRGGGAGYIEVNNDSPICGGLNAIGGGGGGPSSSTLRNTSTFISLPARHKERIERVAKELKGKWSAVPSQERSPASGLAEQKSAEYYAAAGRKL